MKSFRAAAVAGTILATSLSVGSFPVHADDETASSTAAGKRYWSIMQTSPAIERVAANEALLDYAVGTINTQYYDNTGGARFNAQEFYRQWKTMKRVAEHEVPVGNTRIPADISLESRDGSVHGLKWHCGCPNLSSALGIVIQDDSHGHYLGRRMRATWYMVPPSVFQAPTAR